MTIRGHIKNGVAVFDEPSELPDGTAVRIEVDLTRTDFWKAKTVEELAAEQGVKPLRSMDQLAGDWPEEDSVDEFIALTKKSRT